MDEYPVDVQDFTKCTNRFRGIYRIDLESIKKKPEDVNTKLVGVGNYGWILTDYAQRFPWTLFSNHRHFFFEPDNVAQH